MSLFVRIILWGLLLLMLKDARSQSRTQTISMEAGCSKISNPPTSNVIENKRE